VMVEAFIEKCRHAGLILAGSTYMRLASATKLWAGKPQKSFGWLRGLSWGCWMSAVSICDVFKSVAGELQ
jgi:hypothetical protein